MTALLLTVLLAADPAPPRTAAVRELAPVGLAAPGQATQLSPGRFRALYIEGAKGPVVWEVTPSDVAARVTLTDILPAGTPVYGQIEGTDAPKLHKFPPAASEVLFIAGVGDDKVAFTVNVQAWGVEGGRPKKLADLLVSVSPKTPAAPGPIPPGPGLPPGGGLYFAVVRPDGPASAEFTRIMGLPEWAAIRAAGHMVKDFTPDRAVAILGAGVVPPGTTLPVVVTLRSGAAGSTILRGPVPLPATGAAVLELPKGVN